MRSMLVTSKGLYVSVDGERTWPSSVNAMREMEWTLRYGSTEDIIKNRFLMASIVAGYFSLIDSTQKDRNYVCQQIKNVSGVRND